jgi:hypothetical protein
VEIFSGNLRAPSGTDQAAAQTKRTVGDGAGLPVADARTVRVALGGTSTQSDLNSIIRSAWEWRLRHPCGFDTTSSRTCDWHLGLAQVTCPRECISNIKAKETAAGSLNCLIRLNGSSDGKQTRPNTPTNSQSSHETPILSCTAWEHTSRARRKIASTVAPASSHDALRTLAAAARDNESKSRVITNCSSSDASASG